MIRRPPISTRTDTLFPDTTLFRSHDHRHLRRVGARVAQDLDRPRHVQVRHHDGAGAGQAGRHEGLEPGRSEEHTSELQSLMRNSYAVFCLKKKNNKKKTKKNKMITAHTTTKSANTR